MSAEESYLSNSKLCKEQRKEKVAFEKNIWLQLWMLHIYDCIQTNVSNGINLSKIFCHCKAELFHTYIVCSLQLFVKKR